MPIHWASYNKSKHNQTDSLGQDTLLKQLNPTAEYRRVHASENTQIWF